MSTNHPTEQQIAEIRAREPGTLLLFRTETGYVAYDNDAIAIAGVTGAPLGSHSSGRRVAWFHEAKLETYLKRVVEAGRRAAVCEQVKAAKRAK